MRSTIRCATVSVASTRGGAEDGDNDADLLSRGIAVLDPDRRDNRLGARRVAHSGMFPCFFGGRLSRLVLRARSARMTFIRVLLGVMTVSM